jgi:hypothetical protein
MREALEQLKQLRMKLMRTHAIDHEKTWLAGLYRLDTIDHDRALNRSEDTQQRRLQANTHHDSFSYSTLTFVTGSMGRASRALLPDSTTAAC